MLDFRNRSLDALVHTRSTSQANPDPLGMAESTRGTPTSEEVASYLPITLRVSLKSGTGHSFLHGSHVPGSWRPPS